MIERDNGRPAGVYWASLGLGLAIGATAIAVLFPSHQRTQGVDVPNGLDLKIDFARLLAQARADNISSAERIAICDQLQRDPAELLRQRETLIDMLRDPSWDNRYIASILVQSLGKDGAEFAGAIMTLLKKELPRIEFDGRATYYLSTAQASLDQAYPLPLVNRRVSKFTDRTITAAAVLEISLHNLALFTDAHAYLTEAKTFSPNPQYRATCDKLIESLH